MILVGIKTSHNGFCAHGPLFFNAVACQQFTQGMLSMEKHADNRHDLSVSSSLDVVVTIIKTLESASNVTVSAGVGDEMLSC